MTNLPVLYIDLDGVCADLESTVRKYNPAIVLTDDGFRDQMDSLCEANPRIFLELDPIPGAIDAINRLNESGKFDILFLSTPMWNIVESFMDKRIWLEKHFGDWVKDRLVLSKRKDLSLGNILIDDRLKNRVDKFQGHHIHFGTEKFPDWESVLKLLL